MSWHDRIRGYRVVQTDLSHQQPAVDLEPLYEPHEYDKAIRHAHEVRLQDGPVYARIDVLYIDGSRGIL